MAANNNGSSRERTNYYNISYGMLATRLKEIPEGYSEINEAELKSRSQAIESIDLRSKYVKKTGDYPYSCFFTDITGTIQKVEKDKHDKGVTLVVTILDTDEETSILQTKFYGKVSADFLNRLLSIKDINAPLTFKPYSIPTTAEIDGDNVEYYSSGVSIKEDGAKTERAFKKESELPGSERVQDAEGNLVTSRVKQINFLWEKVDKKYNGGEAKTTAKAPVKKTAAAVVVGEDEVEDDLPF